jgi:hypothetical protein
LTASNVTISGNIGNESGGLRTIGSLETVLTNTIVAGNELDILGPLTSSTTSVIGIPVGKTLADILVVDNLGKPVLADNGGPTKTIALALVAGNPAIDAATGAVCAAPPVGALDQRGRTRPAACDIGAYEAQAPTIAARANVSAAATSAAGAVVTYTAPAGTTEQGGAATVVCVPASGSAFPVGTTTVTCTATDGASHTAITTFQVVLSAFVQTASPFIPTLPPTDVTAMGGTTSTSGLSLVLGLLGILGLVVVRCQGPTTRSRR